MARQLYAQRFSEAGDNMTRVIAAFPGTGKSTFSRGRADCSDSDSSRFDKAQFPQNYITYIRSLIGKKTYVFVSSHKTVRDALYAAGIPFDLVIPAIECKEEYLKRFTDRGNAEGFIQLVANNWSDWLSDCVVQQGVDHLIILSPGEFIADYFS